MDRDLGPLGDFYQAKFLEQCLAIGAGRELPETIDWARVDMAVDEILRQMLVTGATQQEFARSIAGIAAGGSGTSGLDSYLRDRLEIAERQVRDGPIVPLWRRFVTSCDVSRSFLYPDPDQQIVDVEQAFQAGLNWANDGGQSALVWGLHHPDEARRAFDIPRRLRARIERLSTIAVDFDVEAAEAAKRVDYIIQEYGSLP
jgi:hypothetical protein